MKYFWHQRYAIDRFDLEDQNGHLIGWITRNRIDDYPMSDLDTAHISRDCLGYIASYRLVSSPNAKYIWRIWWVERDDNGYCKSESSSDNIQYPSINDAKIALEYKFINPNASVQTINWIGNLTVY